MEKVKANPDLEMQQSKTVRKEKAEAEEGLLLARRARQEKELQKKEMSGLGAAVNNDYYSPVKAAEYIELRLRPAIDFYQKRVPTKTQLRTFFKLMLLTATVASSFLARHQLSQLVTIVTAFASMITAYSEFADADRKVERYSRSITAIKDLLTAWDSMSYVQKASPVQVGRLILGGEAIINDERLAWQKTAVRKDSGAGGEEKVRKGTVKATSKATVKDTDDDTDTALGLFGIRQQ